jgi:aryl-alcohol dehydrogenase-like predicted oxidoreductase
MKRRDFVRNTSLAGSGLLAMGGLKSAAAFKTLEGKSIPLATLGRTGEKVSMIGIGGGHWGHEDVGMEDVQNLFNRALEAGINYFDTAPNYGDGVSEQRLGEAMKGKRDKVFLVSKTESPTYEGTWKSLEASLKNLQTDSLDLLHLHNFGFQERWTDLDMAFGKKGAMGALREAKKKGMIRYIGASGHLYPSRFHYVINSGEIDVIMTAVNYIVQHTYDFEHKIWARAKTEDIGLVAMKAFGGRYGKPGNFRIPTEDYDSALRYVLSLDGLSTAVLGVTDAGQLEQALRLMKDFKPMTEEEFLQLSQRGLEILQKDPEWRAIYGTPVA